ncbi:MAG TPA: ATP-binding protein [Gemmatimonadaceae bacterium]|nr:ATP-binding protein [Gemmatimonadaceae bacterium]
MAESADRPLLALLIEDNPADAELIALRLQSPREPPEQAPVRLIHADTIASACAALQQVTVDVIILDLSLPDASQLEALHRVRMEAPEVPVIILTGKADEALAVESLRAGAQDYVLKPPPDGRSLRRILRYARERQRLLRERNAAVRESSVAVQRWRLLAEAGQLLVALPDQERALHQVAQLLVTDAADCVVLYVAGDGDVRPVLEVACVTSDQAREIRERVAVFLTDLGAEAHGLFDSVDASDAMSVGVVQQLFASLGAASGTVFPIRFRQRAVGFLLLGMMAGHGRDAGVDAELARSLADRIGLAVDAARLMRQAQLAAAARDHAVGIVSHDLGNPLTTIEICAAALLEPSPPPASGVRNMGQLIQHATQWMRRIVRDLLDRASLDAGRLRLDRQPTTAAEVVREVETVFGMVAAERDLDFVIDCDPRLPTMNADPHRLVQVLSNLLGNAMKFTLRGGRVVLSITSKESDPGSVPALGVPGSIVRFAVRDTGPGIPAADLEHVFDWFWRSNDQARTGTGLGLAIAKGLVEAHGGDLHVESELGQGATFWFTVPAAVDQLAGIS